ncbi:MAG: biopolymer transporter ExbD [Leptospiraceae bacterium]|nr:biopolymer transporter ExbD [Leptospiraceae bacterium]MCB1202394.1 biopolymer transporter ExbD [Leptospiraceae bacterium]
MAGSAGGSGKSGAIGEINVVPLVDIMLVLVIILMVSAEFTKYRTVSVQLPKINAAAVKQEPVKVTLTLKPDGSLYWDNKQVEDIATLQERLTAEKSARPEMAVIMRAEGDTSYKQVLQILDKVKLAGIAKVGLAVEEAAAPRRR